MVQLARLWIDSATSDLHNQGDEERQALQDEQPQQNPVFDEEQDDHPQQDHVFDDEYDQQQQQFDDEHGQQHQPEEPMFPGGPYDLYVLKDYEHHIAINVWNGHRWHAETSSFHLPFGEMTITLDDVRGLLSIPCFGEFFIPLANVNEDLAIAAAVELLGVAYDEAVTETRTNRGCIILADKSFTLVSAKYLFLFQDLDTCGKWAWGPAALVVLYDYLRDSTLSATKQIGGYISLFQTWIYEHFPDICKRDMDELISSMPWMFRWTAKQTSENVAFYRAKLDALRDIDIIWTLNYDENSMTRF
uniref:Protein MAIN-LIKE 1-like n=1 Tax=Cicer arietinum TaxID=3827 RepID=A0A1S2Z8E2_CICAR|nr:protein MAIN-LIKE 1-like [Cicer arietinum]